MLFTEREKLGLILVVVGMSDHKFFLCLYNNLNKYVQLSMKLFLRFHVEKVINFLDYIPKYIGIKCQKGL